MSGEGGVSRGTVSRVAYFAPDWRDPAVRRRVDGLRANGHDVVMFAFERGRLSSDSRPACDIVDLGAGDHPLSVRRLAHLAVGLWRAVRAADRLDGADVVVARNLDMALLALVMRAVARSRVPLVHELLDVRRVALEPGVRGRLVRLVERRVLARSASVIVSSPGFVEHYLRPVQGYEGRHAVVENRLAEPPLDRRPASSARGVRPLRLVWAGSLRCRRSLDLLDAATRRLDGRLTVELHGRPLRIGLDRFQAIVDANPHLTWHGPYPYPEGLVDVYADADLAWCVDLADSPGNSDWLLPNRLYEGLFFNVPAVAIAGTTTGWWVERARAGLVLADDSPEALVAAIDRAEATWAEVAERAARVPTSLLVGTDDLGAALAEVIDRPARPSIQEALA